MAKTYKAGDLSFQMIDDELKLLNSAAPLIARLRKLSYEYTKDLDFTEEKAYKDKLQESLIALEQLRDILETGKDENDNEITEEKRQEITGRITGLETKVKEIQAEFTNNIPLQNLIALKSELESYALIELLTDLSLIKPIFKKILIGDIEKIDWPTAGEFVREVVTDFFTVMNKLKL